MRSKAKVGLLKRCAAVSVSPPSKSKLLRNFVLVDW